MSTRRSARVRPVEAPHWLLGGEPPRRRWTDSDAIVREAHALVHAGGSDALTMRALAGALRTSTSELYRHVPSKQWLLIAIVDHVLAEVDAAVPERDGRSPRDRLERLSDSLRDVLAAHPHLHEILASHTAVTPSTVRLAEAGLTCLRDLGIDEPHLVDAYNAWCGYVIGFTAIEVKPRELAPDAALQRAMRTQLDAAALEDAPVLSERRGELVNRAFGLSWRPARFGGSSSSFAWGLHALLDGFERGVATRRAR
jgi:AcrR family transcriptional regulator